MSNRNFVRAALLALCLCAVVAAQPQCSNQTLAGTWAYKGIGWTIPTGQSDAVPLTMIGVITVDYSGKSGGPGTEISGAAVPGTPIPAGQPLDFDIVNGTIQVTADCTAVFKYSIQLKGMGPMPPIGPYVDRLVVMPTQNEVYGMSVASPLSKPMDVYSMKQISHAPVSVSWPAAQ